MTPDPDMISRVEADRQTQEAVIAREARMSEMLVTIFLENAQVHFRMNVELYSGATAEDLDDIARQLFPHVDPHHVYAELTGGKDE